MVCASFYLRRLTGVTRTDAANTCGWERVSFPPLWLTQERAGDTLAVAKGHDVGEIRSGLVPIDQRKLRIGYAIVLALSLVFTLYEELHLRRWLFHQHGFAAIIAGSLPNFLAVLLASAAIAVIRVPQTGSDAVRLVASIVCGLCLYEVAQIWMPHMTFDWNDMAATFIGGLFSWLLLLALQQGLAPSGPRLR